MLQSRRLRARRQDVYREPLVVRVVRATCWCRAVILVSHRPVEDEPPGCAGQAAELSRGARERMRARAARRP